ncbi:MAG: hypothetical protein RM021_026750 [Nostoc sp. EkiNYC01]|nr:hypothetical protein [Nostoc sp. EkiNYC01]
MKILSHKDAINRRLYERIIIVETAIYRVSYLNRTVLSVELKPLCSDDRLIATATLPASHTEYRQDNSGD